MRQLAVVIALLLVAGCTTSGSVSAEAAAWSKAQAFTELVWSNDLAGARTWAAPGSAATRYLDHLAALAEATADDASSGAPVPPGGSPESITLRADDASHSITIDSGGQVVKWRAFTSDDSGLVTGWLIGDSDTPLADRLWSTSGEAVAEAGRLELVSAFRNDNGLWVVLRLTAAGGALDGLAADQVSAPDSIAAGGRSPIALGFKQGSLGGTLTYRLLGVNGRTISRLRLPIA